jgi:hypothetical protein
MIIAKAQRWGAFGRLVGATIVIAKADHKAMEVGLVTT